MEFRTFDKVQGIGGRAACQDDWETFSIMRRSQYLPWEEELLEQWRSGEATEESFATLAMQESTDGSK